MEAIEYIGIERVWRIKKNTGHTLTQLLLQSREILQDNNNLNDLMEKSMTIYGMKQALDITIEAIKNNKKIGIIGDYDVDGSSSISIMIIFFRLLKKEIVFRIPNRFTDGYGPSKFLINEMSKNEVNLLFIADCGSTSKSEIKYAREKGIDVIVIDHHFLKEDDMPMANAIINPQVNQHEMTYLCSAGLTFVFLCHLKKKINSILLDKDKWNEMCEIAALGTVCDMVPLIGLNRYIVKKGIVVSNKPNSLMRNYLPKDNKYYDEVSEGYMGFYIGPKINSAGRFGYTELAVYSFIYDNPAEYVQKMDILNNARKKIEKIVLNKSLHAIKQNSNNVLQNDSLIIITEDAENGFFSPVLGIVAGKLKDREKKSVFLISWIGNTGKGSARSFDQLNIGNAMALAKQKNIILEGGGHKNAGGFTISKEKLTEFFEHLNKCTEKYLVSNQETIDSVLSLNALNKNIIKILKAIGPFGQRNHSPIFLFPQVKIKRYYLSDSGVIICTINDYSGKKTISAICMANENFLLFLEHNRDKYINIIANIQESGKDISLRILDFLKKT